MFGLIISGRLVTTDFTKVDDNHIVFLVSDAEKVGHVVVFMTGTTPFPDGLGGAVYYGTPEAGRDPVWQYLGFVSNEKPSAVFKVVQAKSDQQISMNGFMQNQPTLEHQNALIGISVEPLTVIAGLQPSINSQSTTLDSFVEYSQKMLENFANFITSFSVAPTAMVASENYVPLSTVQKWYENFQRRLQANPAFWK